MTILEQKIPQNFKQRLHHEWRNNSSYNPPYPFAFVSQILKHPRLKTTLPLPFHRTRGSGSRVLQTERRALGAWRIERQRRKRRKKKKWKERYRFRKMCYSFDTWHCVARHVTRTEKSRNVAKPKKKADPGCKRLQVLERSPTQIAGREKIHRKAGFFFFFFFRPLLRQASVSLPVS